MAYAFNPNSSSTNTITTGPFIWSSPYLNTTTTTSYTTVYPYFVHEPAKKEEEMQTTIVVLPEGYVGIVTVNIDQKNVPIGRTKVFPFKEFPDAKADARARKAAQQLVLKMARKMV